MFVVVSRHLMRRQTVCRLGAIICLSLASMTSVQAAKPAADPSLPVTGISDRIVQFIDQEIAQGWEDNEVQPSAVASDAEWMRRVYLDIVGHIPPAKKVDAFLADKSTDKRAKLIDELLADPNYVRNFTEVWTNILIGRVTPDKTSRNGMRKFLRESFARNRPWNDIVYDLLTAEGNFEENGAVNFILAQLDMNPNSEEYHVQATASAARIFLGMQVQCTQCHNHPFNEWKQNQFWEFNAFFRQSRRMDYEKYDPASGRMVDDYSELVYRDFSGPVYFENRAGLVQVAYPTYAGTEIDRDAPDRRAELAKVICKVDPNQQLARAMVNRTWGYFLGYGFTRPVDDMGPHNPESHPAIADRLTEEFVTSGYDVKKLMKWICNSKAYNLTSQFNPKNEIDNPSAGEVPLFSHVYVKTMQAEQLYDSLMIATSADGGGEVLAGAEQERERWLRDFLRIFGGNEEDESTYFSGSIPQALLMMNGPLVQKAISSEQGNYVTTVLNSSKYPTDHDRIKAMFLAALGRPPERTELAALGRLMQAERNPVKAYQDLYWALLNSNEFVVNH